VDELKMLVEKGRDGETVKLALDAEVIVLVAPARDGGDLDVIVVGGADEHAIPVDLAEVLEEHFGNSAIRADGLRNYGPMRITIERR